MGKGTIFSLAVCIEKRFSKLVVNYISSAVCFCFGYVGNVVGDYFLFQILNVVKYWKYAFILGNDCIDVCVINRYCVYIYS